VLCEYCVACGSLSAAHYQRPPLCRGCGVPHVQLPPAPPMLELIEKVMKNKRKKSMARCCSLLLAAALCYFAL
jgi:hypothetical protein